MPAKVIVIKRSTKKRIRSVNFRRKIKRIFSTFGFEILSNKNEQFLRKNPFEVKRRLLRGIECPVIIDVGAFIGDITELYRELFPNSTIYCLEPFEETYSILKDRFRTDTKIRTYNAALAEKSETANFYVNKNLRTNSLLALDAETEINWPTSNLEHRKDALVHCYSFDDFSRAENIDRVHLLKIDAQGAEFLILKGAFDALKHRKVKIIYLEVLLKPTYKQQAKFQDILGYLADLDYSLYDVYNPSYAGDGSLRQIDVIFVARRFLENAVLA